MKDYKNYRFEELKEADEKTANWFVNDFIKEVDEVEYKHFVDMYIMLNS